MAMYDSIPFLVSHIRQSFITSDDTQMSELIIENEDVTEKDWNAETSRWKVVSNSQVKPQGDDGRLSRSYDILPDMDFSARRRRSNTEMRLDKLKQERKLKKTVHHVQWRGPSETVTDNDLNEMFSKKEVSAANKPKGSSKLSHLMELNKSSQDNPFNEYAKYDGKINPGSQSKQIDIYCTMQSEDDRGIPIKLCVLADTKIQNMIGLICFHYYAEKRQPPLRGDSDDYLLYIAEDDGEADMEFQAIDNREPISKFGFTKLALVETEPQKNTKSVIVVTVLFPGKGSTKLQVQNMSTTVREIVDISLKKRLANRQGRVLEYNLEKMSQPGVVLDPDTQLSAMDTLEFCLVRENSKRGDLEEPEPTDDNKHTLETSITSLQYKSYRVSLPHKLISSKEAQLGISGEKIEIDPVVKKSKLFKQKAFTYEMDTVAMCEITEEKSAGRAVFRLVIVDNGTDIKHDFEAPTPIAKEIVQKVNQIVEMCASPVKKEYLERKAKRLSTLFYS